MATNDGNRNNEQIYNAGVARVQREDEPVIEVTATAVPGYTEAHVVGSGAGARNGGDGTGAGSSVQRFFCSNCQAPYNLPYGATTWRCSHCLTFNNINGHQASECTIS